MTAGGAALAAGVVAMTVPGAGRGGASSSSEDSSDEDASVRRAYAAGDDDAFDAVAVDVDFSQSQCSVSKLSIMGAFPSALKS